MSSKIGFIGVGNMGTALIKGMAGRKDVEVHGVDLNVERLQALHKECGLVVHSSPEELAKACDYVVVAVKPQHAEPVVKSIASALGSSTCLLSICAGIPQARFKEWTDDRCPVVRVMPNTPALVGAGVFALCFDDAAVTEAMRAFIPDAFGAIGQVHVLPEKLFDAFTAVVGSGPAYVFYFMEALMESGVSLGLTRAQSTEMVEALFLGSAKLASESDLHISQLREMVTSPAGTTIQATQHMDRTGTRGNIVDAVRESYLRSIELGE